MTKEVVIYPNVNKMKVSELLPNSESNNLLSQKIAYFPTIAKAIGSVNAAVFLCQFMYWEGKQSDSSRWIHKTRDKIYEETGLSRTEQETVRKLLINYKVMEETRLGLCRKCHFRFNWKMLDTILNMYEENKKEAEKISESQNYLKNVARQKQTKGKSAEPSRFQLFAK